MPSEDNMMPVIAITRCEDLSPRTPRIIPAIPTTTPQMGMNQAHKLIMPSTIEMIAYVFLFDDEGISLGE
jgi:hypothetical protein